MKEKPTSMLTACVVLLLSWVSLLHGSQPEDGAVGNKVLELAEISRSEEKSLRVHVGHQLLMKAKDILEANAVNADEFMPLINMKILDAYNHLHDQEDDFLDMIEKIPSMHWYCHKYLKKETNSVCGLYTVDHILAALDENMGTPGHEYWLADMLAAKIDLLVPSYALMNKLNDQRFLAIALAGRYRVQDAPRTWTNCGPYCTLMQFIFDFLPGLLHAKDFRLPPRKLHVQYLVRDYEILKFFTDYKKVPLTFPEITDENTLTMLDMGLAMSELLHGQRIAQARSQAAVDVVKASQTIARQQFENRMQKAGVWDQTQAGCINDRPLIYYLLSKGLVHLTEAYIIAVKKKKITAFTSEDLMHSIRTFDAYGSYSLDLTNIWKFSQTNFIPGQGRGIDNYVFGLLLDALNRELPIIFTALLTSPLRGIVAVVNEARAIRKTQIYKQVLSCAELPDDDNHKIVWNIPDELAEVHCPFPFDHQKQAIRLFVRLLLKIPVRECHIHSLFETLQAREFAGFVNYFLQRRCLAKASEKRKKAELHLKYQTVIRSRGREKPIDPHEETNKVEGETSKPGVDIDFHDKK